MRKGIKIDNVTYDVKDIVEFTAFKEREEQSDKHGRHLYGWECGIKFEHNGEWLKFYTNDKVGVECFIFDDFLTVTDGTK